MAYFSEQEPQWRIRRDPRPDPARPDHRREAGADLRHVHQPTIAEENIGLLEIGVELNRRGRENTIHAAQGLGCLGDQVQDITTHASFSASRMGSGTAKRIFYEPPEVKPRRQIFSLGSRFSFSRRTFHVSILPPGCPARRVR